MILGIDPTPEWIEKALDTGHREREEAINEHARILVGVRKIKTTFDYLIGLQACYATRSYRARHGEICLTVLNNEWREGDKYPGPLINRVMRIFRDFCDEATLPSPEQRRNGADIPPPLKLLLGDGKGGFPDAIRPKSALKAEYRKLFFGKHSSCKMHKSVAALGPNLSYFFCAVLCQSVQQRARSRFPGSLPVLCVRPRRSPSPSRVHRGGQIRPEQSR